MLHYINAMGTNRSSAQSRTKIRRIFLQHKDAVLIIILESLCDLKRVKKRYGWATNERTKV